MKEELLFGQLVACSKSSVIEFFAAFPEGRLFDRRRTTLMHLLMLMRIRKMRDSEPHDSSVRARAEAMVGLSWRTTHLKQALSRRKMS